MARDLGPKRNNGTGLTRIIEFELWNNPTFWEWNTQGVLSWSNKILCPFSGDNGMRKQIF